MKRRAPTLIVLVTCVVLLTALAVEFGSILSAFGGFLNRGEAPQKADAALVLAGGFNGERVLRAAELAREGYVPRVYLSGPPFVYGRRECELGADYAVAHGYARNVFECLPNEGLSTLAEAQECCRVLRQNGFQHVLLVTTTFHTRRARAMYARACPLLRFTVVGAESPRYALSEWYKQREGRKDVAIEYMKLLTWRFGM